MKIIEKYPPNYKEIEKAFDLTGLKPIFTYESKLYNPHQVEIHPNLMAHEEVHERQQGKNPKAWWDRYLIDSAFRLDQELEAYATQYAFIKKTAKSRICQQFLEWFGLLLSSPMYGNLLNQAQAESRIRSKAKTL